MAKDEEIKSEDAVKDSQEGQSSQNEQRRLVIVTDGNNFSISNETTCTPLEIKEICREILSRS